MADSGMECNSPPVRGRLPKASWQTMRRQIAARLDAVGMQAAALFGLLFLLQLSVGALAPWGVSLGSWWDCVHLATLGASFTPPALLALWAVFGPQRVAVRLPLAVWLTTALYLATAYGEYRNGGDTGYSLLFGEAWLMAFTIGQLPLWLLRWGRRWRLVAAEGESATIVPAECRAGEEALRSDQFTLRALLGWTLAAAVSLAALRCLSTVATLSIADLPSMLVQAGFEGAIIALPGLPIVGLAWILLADGRRIILRSILGILTLAGLAIGLAVIWANAQDVEEVGSMALFEAGAIFNGLLALSIVRACGYRLRRRSKRTDQLLLPGAPVYRPLGRWRFAVAATPILATAAVLACSVPERLENWEREDVARQWRKLGVRVSFDDGGRINRVECKYQLVSDDVLRQISQLANVEMLNLTGASLDDRQLALLAPLKQLQSLTIGHTGVTDDGLMRLRQFPQLSFLDLTGTAITDAGVEQIKPLTSLLGLSMSLTDVTDESLAALATMPQLWDIDAELTGITADGAAMLRRRRPNVRLRFGASDELLARSLAPHGVAYESLPTAGRSMGIAQRIIKLKRLHAQGKSGVDGVRCTVTDAGLAALADQTELEQLDLRDSGVTDQGLTALQKLKSLKWLDVRGTAVTEEGADVLVQALRECEVLR